jgi:hypothetical protein
VDRGEPRQDARGGGGEGRRADPGVEHGPLSPADRSAPGLQERPRRDRPADAPPSGTHARPPRHRRPVPARPPSEADAAPDRGGGPGAEGGLRALAAARLPAAGHLAGDRGPLRPGAGPRPPPPRADGRAARDRRPRELRAPRGAGGAAAARRGPPPHDRPRAAGGGRGPAGRDRLRRGIPRDGPADRRDPRHGLGAAVRPLHAPRRVQPALEAEALSLDRPLASRSPDAGIDPEGGDGGRGSRDARIRSRRARSLQRLLARPHRVRPHARRREPRRGPRALLQRLLHRGRGRADRHAAARRDRVEARARTAERPPDPGRARHPPHGERGATLDGLRPGPRHGDAAPDGPDHRGGRERRPASDSDGSARRDPHGQRTRHPAPGGPPRARGDAACRLRFARHGEALRAPEVRCRGEDGHGAGRHRARAPQRVAHRLRAPRRARGRVRLLRREDARSRWERPAARSWRGGWRPGPPGASGRRDDRPPGSAAARARGPGPPRPRPRPAAGAPGRPLHRQRGETRARSRRPRAPGSSSSSGCSSGPASSR